MKKEFEDKSKKLREFLDANKSAYSEMMVKYVELFNKIGVETDEGVLQTAFVGTVIYTMLISVNCEKRQKQRLLRNISAKLP